MSPALAAWRAARRAEALDVIEGRIASSASLRRLAWQVLRQSEQG